MYRKTLTKPDGRNLNLYARYPMDEDIQAVNPVHNVSHPNPHMRWHPLKKEWVIYASHRQNRTFLPPKDYSPLKVMSDEKFPTEMPKGNYEVAVFQNLFPSMLMSADAISDVHLITQPSRGSCEVVVFTQDPDKSLGELPVGQIDLILEVLGERTEELAKNQDIKYVMPFENRGVEQGVTLHHPHGQIYAYPFTPPLPQQILTSMREHFETTGTNLMGEFIKGEIKDGRRILFENDEVIAFIPACARYAYETWITTKRNVSYLHELTPRERKSLAICLKTVLMKFDKLWEKPFPYLMTLIQAPLNEGEHPYAHFFFQIFPPYRSKDRLKYLAGTELGAGIFVNDSLPEDKAQELKNISVEVKDG
jgi:UDPglucose--hexose-1-phosphate uridylyltransferase